MPTKEELEAELNASEKDKAIAKLRELIADIDEWEADLQALEREVWQPHWSHSDPLADRLRRVGFEGDKIREVERRMTVMGALIRGEPIPSDIQAEIDSASAAEDSALSQLATVVSASRINK
jgi:hypothetical protein